MQYIPNLFSSVLNNFELLLKHAKNISDSNNSHLQCRLQEFDTFVSILFYSQRRGDVNKADQFMLIVNV